jgi:hypothetical protein
MIDIPGKASVSSGMIGPHISGEVAVTMIGTPKTLTAFASATTLCFSSVTGMAFEELQRHQVCVATYPSHPLARGQRAGLEQVAKERLVAFTRADYPEHQAWIADLFAPLNRRRTRQHHEPHRAKVD